MSRVLVTGASGFIGRHLVACLRSAGFKVRCAFRRPQTNDEAFRGCETVVVGDIADNPEWLPILRGVDMVAHIAGRAHIGGEARQDALDRHRTVNVEATRLLARAAKEAGVGRFLYLSSIGVLGDQTLGRKFDEKTQPQPRAPYAISKLEAEEWLIREAGPMEVVIVRPPLVYGPGNPGNFLKLIRLVAKGYPLPFASIRNRRSFIYIGNLVDLLKVCLVAPNAAGQVYVVGDGEAISLPSLVSKIGDALGRPVMLIPVPPGLLQIFGRIVGAQELVAKLTESLEVSSGKIRRDLVWVPPVSMDQGIADTVNWFLGREKT